MRRCSNRDFSNNGRRRPGVIAATAGLLASCLLLLTASNAPAGEPVRVATLLPFVEDALRDMPGDAVVVASVRRSMSQPTAAGVADLGNPHSPSFEALAASRPDLIVGDASIHARLAPRLERFGAEVMLLETPSVEATFEALSRVGERVGAGVEMQTAIDASRSEIRSLGLETPVSTLVLFGAPGTFYAMTERTWLGDLIAQLEFANAAPSGGGHERFPGLVALSDEVVAGLSPKLVLLVTHGDPTAIRAALAKRIEGGGAWRGFREAAAIEVLEPELFAANPGLGMTRAARELVALTPTAATPPVAAGPPKGSAR